MQGTDLNSAVPTLQLAAEELAPLTQAARATSWRQALSDAYEVQRPVVYRAAASAFLTSWMPLLPSAPTGSVLNLDASLGAVSEGLAYHYPHVVHVSLDPAHLAFSRTRLLQEGALNVDCVESDPLELPVMDEGADLVVAVHLFQLARRYAEGARARQEHMERELATEVFRVLKPGGVALFGIQGRPGSRSPLPNSLHVFGTAKGHYRRLFDRTGFESASFYAASSERRRATIGGCSTGPASRAPASTRRCRTCPLLGRSSPWRTAWPSRASSRSACRPAGALETRREWGWPC